MTDEKQINNTKNQRRDNYCIRIQKALQYKGNCDHKDLPSILVAFEKEIKNELLPENAVVLTPEELENMINTTDVKIKCITDIAINARKEAVQELIDKIVWFSVKRIGQNTAETYLQISYERLVELAKECGVGVD